MAFLSHVCGPLPSSVSRCEIQPVSFVFHPGDLLDWQSCRELLPTDTELAGLVTLDAVRAWVNLDAAVWQAAPDALGTVPSMRVLAVSPADSISSMITGLRLPLLEGDGQPMLDADGQPMWWVRVSWLWHLVSSTHAFCSSYACVWWASAGGVPVRIRKVKVSQILDQLDDTELELLGRDALDEAFRI